MGSDPKWVSFGSNNVYESLHSFLFQFCSLYQLSQCLLLMCLFAPLVIADMRQLRLDGEVVSIEVSR